MANPVLFLFILILLKDTCNRKKLEGFNGIRTRIVGVEGEHWLGGGPLGRMGVKIENELFGRPV